MYITIWKNISNDKIHVQYLHMFILNNTIIYKNSYCLVFHIKFIFNYLNNELKTMKYKEYVFNFTITHINNNYCKYN